MHCGHTERPTCTRSHTHANTKHPLLILPDAGCVYTCVCACTLPFTESEDRVGHEQEVLYLSHEGTLMLSGAAVWTAPWAQKR